MSKHHWSTGYCHYDDMLAAHLNKAGLWKNPGVYEISVKSKPQNRTTLKTLCCEKRKDMSIITASQIAKFWKKGEMRSSFVCVCVSVSVCFVVFMHVTWVAYDWN